MPIRGYSSYSTAIYYTLSRPVLSCPISNGPYSTPSRYVPKFLYIRGYLLRANICVSYEVERDSRIVDRGDIG